MDAKLKHLEFLQNVIMRMNSNSFLIKGWTITLACVIFTLVVNYSNIIYLVIMYIPTVMFWLLDGYYLIQERRYRDLFDNVVTQSEEAINFDLDASKFDHGKNTFISAIFSKTVVPLYITIIVATTAIHLFQIISKQFIQMITV